MKLNLCARCLLLQFRHGSKVSARVLEKALQDQTIFKRQTRNVATTSFLMRSTYHLNLSKQNVNMQKTKQIRHTEDYILEKVEEYDLGVRRLAQMMGEDPASFSETDVKRSINYLFPCGLYAKQARPLMQHPSVVFPPEITVQADKDGRHRNFLFFTLNAEFYELLHDMYGRLLKLQSTNDKRTFMGLKPEGELNLTDPTWITKGNFEQKFLGKSTINLTQYRQLISQLERLVEEPYAYGAKDYIMQFVEEKRRPTDDSDLEQQEICTGDDGREFVVAHGRRKSARATVKLILKGTGRIMVNGEELNDFFPLIYDREVVIAPFNLLNLHLTFDVEATVSGALQGIWDSENGNPPQRPLEARSALAGAIRLGICRAMVTFVDDQTVEIMRRAGLLMRDPRRKERKKPGKWKARKRYAYKKR